MRIFWGSFILVLSLNCAHQPKSAGPAKSKSAPVIDREATRQAINSRIRDFGQCYKRALKKHPGLSGRMVVRFDLEEDKEPHNFQIVQSLDPDVDQCFVEVIRTIEFPSPEAGKVARIRYPFFLDSDEKHDKPGSSSRSEAEPE